MTRVRAAVAQALVSLVLGTALFSGCGKPVLRLADPSLGDYYTDEEFKKLRKEQREEYCNELALQDSTYQDEIREALAALAALQLRRDPLRREADSLGSLVSELERRVAESHASPPRSLPKPEPKGSGKTAGDSARWIVRPGDSLWRIAADRTTYGDGRAWHRLYAANKDRIGSPDRIYPGQEITIPR